MGCRSRDSCHNLLKKLRILPLKSQYISSLLLFVVNNKDQFIVNSENYSINTRQSTNHYLSQANLAISQKGVYYVSIKIYTSLPSDIKNFSNNQKNFKTVSKTFLYTNCFYSLEEFFNVNKEKLDIPIMNSVLVYCLLNVSYFVQSATFIYLVMHSIFYLILYKLW
jgi:hypothetical protein